MAEFAPEIIPGPDHEYVPPPVPISVILGLEQLISEEPLADAVAEIVFPDTVTAAVPVMQLLTSATLTLYVPGDRPDIV